MIKWRRRILVIYCIGLLMVLAGCGTENASQGKADTGRIVMDTAGNQVQVPQEVKRIADLWHANNQVVLLLGGADKLVSTTQNVQQLPWFAKIYPRILDIPAPVKGVDIQLEELEKLHPDVVLVNNEKQLEKIKATGLPCVKVEYQDFDGLKNVINITAQVLGGDAQSRADKYIQQLDKNIELVHSRTQNLSEQEKPKVLHIVGGDDLLKVDGTETLIEQWIQFAGGRNAVEESGFQIHVTMEEIIKSDPDIIIVGGTEGKKGVEKIMTSPEWSSLKAVKNHRVICNPVGTFNWDRYSAEVALQLLWAGKEFHPDLFTDIDLVDKTQKFYREFLQYDLSKEDAERIIRGENPAQEK
jgi:iron complex transport system substrate-binding protein